MLLSSLEMMIITLLALQGTIAFAFSGVPSFRGSVASGIIHSSAATVGAEKIPLFATTTDIDNNGRRDFTSKMIATTVAVAASLSPFKADAETEGEGGGRLIEFTVNNLDGVEGSTGSFVVQTRPEWAPLGAERFEALASNSFFDNCRVFRVLPGFVAQFGINGDPEVQGKWRSQNLKDDPVRVTNKRGTIVFATAGPNTRTTQIFVNLSDRNSFLDKQGFSPLGEVVSGMDVVERFYSGYGEGAPSGKGPNQGLIQAKGNSYLESSYPKLSYFSKVSFK